MQLPKKSEIIAVKRNEVFTTSLIVAEVFEKSHKHVLEKIENLPKDEFHKASFRLVKYKDKKGEYRPMYKITDKGFSLLGMSFTGSKAYHFKVAFINAFESAMEKLRNQNTTPLPIHIHSHNHFLLSLKVYEIEGQERYKLSEVLEKLRYKNKSISHHEFVRYSSEISKLDDSYYVSANYILKLYGNSIAREFRVVIDRKLRTRIIVPKRVKQPTNSNQLTLNF